MAKWAKCDQVHSDGNQAGLPIEDHDRARTEMMPWTDVGDGLKIHGNVQVLFGQIPGRGAAGQSGFVEVARLHATRMFFDDLA